MNQKNKELLLAFADPKTLIPDNTVPLFDTWIRDTHITLAEDGYYYCTGTTRAKGEEAAFRWNDGIQLWRSEDLKVWESMGLVWSFEKNGTWQNKFYIKHGNWSEESRNTGCRALYAPEIYHINGNFYITASINWEPQNEGEEGSCTFLLKSATGRAEGPYVDACNGPLTKRIDSSIFTDDNGDVYYVWQDGRIAKLKKDMSGFAEDPRRVIQQHFDPEPYCEGVFIFKYNNKYHMALAIWTMLENGQAGYFPGSVRQKLSYDCVIATADNIYGPYGERYTSITGGGHNSFFTGKDGTFYATMFGNPVNDSFAPFYARPAVIPMEWENGRLYPKR